uniref:Uncharacterized protein n=1 Tax=Arundo donax TaxID=35708 RepID=A0A0A8Y9G0_ARUDO
MFVLQCSVSLYIQSAWPTFQVRWTRLSLRVPRVHLPDSSSRALYGQVILIFREFFFSRGNEVLPVFEIIVCIE